MLLQTVQTNGMHVIYTVTLPRGWVVTLISRAKPVRGEALRVEGTGTVSLRLKTPPRIA